VRFELAFYAIQPTIKVIGELLLPLFFMVYANNSLAPWRDPKVKIGFNNLSKKC
jgi:hypothetical protein